MGAIISVIRYYICRQLEKPTQIKQGLMRFIFSIIRCFICRQVEKLRKIKRGLMGFIISVIRCFICRPVEEPRKIKKDEWSPEDIHPEEPQMLIENAGNREDESSNLLQQEVLISSARFQYSLDSDRLVNNSEVVEEKTRDECVEEELHSKGPIEKKKDVCLPEDLHSEEPIEDVEEKEEEVTKGVVSEERWINHYSSSQKILLVGEGDFSFSASLAMAFGSASNMIATSLDSRGFLEKNYRRAIYNIVYLTRKGSRVIHEVNAKKMANNPLLKGMTFDRIIYNFPLAGFFETESSESQLGRGHRRLVSQFLKNAKEMISEEGEIHVTHKTSAFPCEWNIEQLASCHGLRLIEATCFDYKIYAGYSPKCGFGGDKDFDCNPCKTYKFGLRTASTEKKKRRNRSRRAASKLELAAEPQ